MDVSIRCRRKKASAIEMDALASERSIPMLRKTMIVLATAAALTGGLTADALARGGGFFPGSEVERQG